MGCEKKLQPNGRNSEKVLYIIVTHLRVQKITKKYKEWGIMLIRKKSQISKGFKILEANFNWTDKPNSFMYLIHFNQVLFHLHV